MTNNIQNCIPCKLFNHWVEIRLVDEQAKPFNGTLKGTLRDNSGSSHTVTFQNGYLLQTGLSAGPVHITIPTENLLKSAYTHGPREAGKASPVPDFAKKEQGYENSIRQYQNITVGDIWLRAPETMPERHKPQATGKKLKLVADNSYVLEVRAFNMLTVRIGMFFDGIGCFQFDVFGFSRGAAAARHFTNQVIKGEDGYFGLAVKKKNLLLSDPFDWKNPQQCQFTFVGIFDTVTAIASDGSAHNDTNWGIDLAVPSAQTKRLVHLTAADEFRNNFSLNRINSASGFAEYSVPGAHSDLGGGYYSRYYLDEQHPERMDNALYCEIIVAAFAGTLVQSQDVQSTSAWKKASDLRNTLIRQGWGNSQQIVLESATIKKAYYYQVPADDLMVRIVMKRVVEGDLSRIYLRAMYGFAKYAHVPLRQFDTSLAVHKVAPELASLADAVLAQAQQNRLAPELLQSGNINRAKYIHYSAEIGTVVAKVIHPNVPSDNNHRSVYLCREYAS